MSKDLTTNSIHRQNILNNNVALSEIENQLDLKGVRFKDQLLFTKKQVSIYYEVDERTIERYIENFSDELNDSGYLVLMYNTLKEFKLAYGNDMNVATMPDYLQKTSVLGVFSFKAFLNIGMLLTESQPAKELRSFLLDIVLDILNQKIGGSTKYINQQDSTFLESSLREYNYRKAFTNALDYYIKPGKLKYGIFTNLVYLSIFKEKATEYKQILKLHKKEVVRDTMYSEILDLISSYENGFANFLKRVFERKGNKKLSLNEGKNLFKEFEASTEAIYQPLIEKARVAMASRDLVFRDALHAKLQKYINPLSAEEFEKFLGEKSKSLQDQIDENIEVFKRLKDR